MLILLFVATGLLILAFFYFFESGLFRRGKIKKYDAVVVDETEDELYDNIGGTNIRFFKVYEYFDGEENRVLKSERPKRKIDEDTGRKCIIYVNSKTRRAMEKKDVILYRTYGSILILLALLLIVGCVYIKLTVPEAVLF